MTKIQHTLVASVLTLLAAGVAQAEPAKATRAVGHGNAANVVKFEKPHPTANLSYKVAGKRYYPQTSADNFSQTGRASWYGATFHGKRTSSGETFDMNAMTAAHRTLPIPSYARVTNLSNGKSVVVRINDRGPFHGSRVMDLSKGAAEKLGFVRQGSAEVKIEILKAGERIDNVQVAKNDAAAPKAKAADTGKNIYVSLKSFDNETDAKAFLKETARNLNQAKLEQRAIMVKRKDDEYVVRVGPFAEQAHVEEMHSRLKQEVI